MDQPNQKYKTVFQTELGLFDRLRSSQAGLVEKIQHEPDSVLADVSKKTVSASVIGDGADSVDLPLEETEEASDAGMPPEARRALVSLLRQGVILASNKGKLFETICRYQPAIRQHLADVYLKLVLDEKMGVAFVAGLPEEEYGDDDEPVSLITHRTLSLYDTLLLLVLRKHYQERELSGEQHIVIDIERVESSMTPFLPLTNSTKTDRRKLSGALQRMVDKRILNSVRGSDDRFEISPIIRYVVNAAFLEEMLAEYHKLATDNHLDLKQGENHE